MEQNQFTGKAIYKKIQELKDELRGIEGATEMAINEFGKEHILYKTLCAQYTEKRAELKNYKNQVFIAE